MFVFLNEKKLISLMRSSLAGKKRRIRLVWLQKSLGQTALIMMNALSF